MNAAMTEHDLEAYLRDLGYTIETLRDRNGLPHLVVRDVEIPAGTLAGRRCDMALARNQSQPYLCPPAIHTRPALAPMDMNGRLKTQASALGANWQYWSRRFDRTPTPRRVWAHVLTVFAEI